MRCLLLICLFVALIAFPAWSEELRLTTYYPSPSGNYANLYVSGNVGIGTVAPRQKLDVRGEVEANGGSPDHAICWKADGRTLGYCASTVGIDGSCTCN